MKQKVLFVVVLEEQPPQQNFSLKNLPGESKIDVVARNILNIYPRLDTNISVTYYAVFTKVNAMALQVKHLLLRDEPYDEIEIASFIRDALQNPIDNLQLDALNNCEDFCWYNLGNFQLFLEELVAKGYSIYYLHEDGKSIDGYRQEIGCAEKISFVLGGRQDISIEHEEMITKLSNKKVNLGEKSYLASSCILKTIFEIDKIHEETS